MRADRRAVSVVESRPFRRRLQLKTGSGGLLREHDLDRLGPKKKFSSLHVSSGDDSPSSALPIDSNDFDGSNEIGDIHPRRWRLLVGEEEVENVVLSRRRLLESRLGRGESDGGFLGTGEERDEGREPVLGVRPSTKRVECSAASKVGLLDHRAGRGRGRGRRLGVASRSSRVLLASKRARGNRSRMRWT